MIILTGGAGFIGSVVLRHLNDAGVDDILIVDHLGETAKWRNLLGKRFSGYMDKTTFLSQVESGTLKVTPQAIIHLGACSSTTERDVDYLMENNLRYSQVLCEYAIAVGARFIYASSAATYGDGSYGYSDQTDQLDQFRPLNPYGFSKQLFDQWVVSKALEDKVCGLKFFNVYGPNEYHKGEMRSVLHKAYHQLRDTGSVKLFRSYHPNYTDGGQKRDFIYVKDCAKVIHWLLEHPAANGIFNLGSGKARSWNELVAALAAAMNTKCMIEYIDMPADLRNQYQYFTEAPMEKLRGTGCPVDFVSIEDGAQDYVTQHLMTSDPVF